MSENRGKTGVLKIMQGWGIGKMECVYCFGHVVVVDSWKNYKVVECAACGVRYDVRDEKEGEKNGIHRN